MNSSHYAYDASFMNLTAQSRRSAETIVGIFSAHFAITSVADFGCALGTWLDVWRRAGVSDALGVDGAYVDLSRLEIPKDLFVARDLALPIDLGRKFDLVESMEVAEHLPEFAAREFVASLARHAELVLFSASPPGQGGENHLNEQPYEYWRERFAEHGYQMFDWIRPQIIDLPIVQYWYRYNIFLFVSPDRVPFLPEAVRKTKVLPDSTVPDLSPWTFRARKRIVRRLSGQLQTGISRAMARIGQIRGRDGAA